MNRSAADVEREVEASREELDRSFEALKDRLTVGQLFDEASRAAGHAGQQVFGKLVGQARQSPMPLAVIGLGLAWLMASRNSNRQDRPWEARAFSTGGGSIADRAGTLRHRAGDVADGVKDRLSSAAAEVRSALSHVSDLADTAVDKATAYRRQAGQGLERALDREPLLLGALGLVAGVAIGSALPATRAEDRAVGPLRDRMVDRGKDLARDGLQQAGEAAEVAYGALKEELSASAEAEGSRAESSSGQGDRSAAF